MVNGRGSNGHDTYTIYIPNDSSNTGEPRTSTGYDAHVFICILACFAFAVVIVVEVRNRFAKGYADGMLTPECNDKDDDARVHL